MAITGSGLFCTTMTDILDTTQLAIDYDLETHKGALFTNSITNDFSADTAYGVAPFNANEVTSGGAWPAGGIALTGTGLAIASGIVTFDATDVSVASTTLTNAEAYLLYADALAGDRALFLVDFGSPFSTVNGTFAITWHATGIFQLDLVP